MSEWAGGSRPTTWPSRCYATGLLRFGVIPLTALASLPLSSASTGSPGQRGQEEMDVEYSSGLVSVHIEQDSPALTPEVESSFQKPWLSQELEHRTAPSPEPTGNSLGFSM